MQRFSRADARAPLTALRTQKRVRPPNRPWDRHSTDAERVSDLPKATQPVGGSGIMSPLGACSPALLDTACDFSPSPLSYSSKPLSQAGQVPSERGHVSPFLLHLRSAQLRFHHISRKHRALPHRSQLGVP